MVNVFDYSGPEFLLFYISLIAAGIFAGILVRYALRPPGGMPMYLPQLEPAEIAFLAGHASGLANATIAALASGHILKPDVTTGRIRRVGPLSAGADHLEQRVYEYCSENGTRLKDFAGTVQGHAILIQSKLQSLELILTPSAAILPKLLPLFIMLFVLIVGIIKIFVGISRDRPVEILVFLCIITFVLALKAFAGPLWRTRRGDAVLRHMRRNNPALRTTAGTHGAKLDPAAVILAYALFGPAVFNSAGGALRDLNTMLRPQRTSSSWGSSCGGGFGCGGGGCGGGGGGCGGCGGG